MFLRWASSAAFQSSLGSAPKASASGRSRECMVVSLMGSPQNRKRIACGFAISFAFIISLHLLALLQIISIAGLHFFVILIEPDEPSVAGPIIGHPGWLLRVVEGNLGTA